jgi:hypothetical protein
VDDGTIIAYPDHERRVRQLLESVQRQPGTADRHDGRKVYYRLRRAGFQDIEIDLFPFNTSRMSREERMALFQQSFGYCSNRLERAIENGTAPAGAEEEVERIEELKYELELDFEDEAFFYQEIVHLGRAYKAS